ncbi:MAG: hypothetical protein ACYC6N_11890 [Pirellulaceae bacterium]
MSNTSPTIVKKIRTLAQIVDDLRHGKDFSITRLTLLKSLCSDPEDAAQFALYLAKKTQQAMKARRRPSHVKAAAWQRYQQLANKGVRGMAGYLKDRTSQRESRLDELLQEIRNEQNELEHQRWATVRIIHSMELLVVETALECVLSPWASSELGYVIARQYAQRYSSQHGTGLIPASAPLVEDIAEFWGRHFLGRGWRKQLAK